MPIFADYAFLQDKSEGDGTLSDKTSILISKMI